MFRKYLSEETLVLHHHYFFFTQWCKVHILYKDTREKHVGGGGARALLIYLICIRVCDSVQGMAFGVPWFSGYAIVHVLYYFALGV